MSVCVVKACEPRYILVYETRNMATVERCKRLAKPNEIRAEKTIVKRANPCPLFSWPGPQVYAPVRPSLKRGEGRLLFHRGDVAGQGVVLKRARNLLLALPPHARAEADDMRVSTSPLVALDERAFVV